MTVKESTAKARCVELPNSSESGVLTSRQSLFQTCCNRYRLGHRRCLDLCVVSRRAILAGLLAVGAIVTGGGTSNKEAQADDALERDATWNVYSAEEMSSMLRATLDEMGIVPGELDRINEQFLVAVEQQDVDPLDAYIASIQSLVKIVDQLVSTTNESVAQAAASIDPSTPGYGAIESLPKSMRNSVRVWLGRELVRKRLYDEALPTFAEVDPVESIDPATVLFFRGACYHALLMKKEALVDLRRLLENEEACPARYARTAQLMIADIKPMKEDSLDEISRLMTDVSRRLELGRSNEDVKEREQKIIDKLTKLIDKIEEQQQQQQQQQQQAAGGSGQGGQGAPMQDSRIADASGNGDVDRKNQSDDGSWGNLPPAERQEALQQIGRDLPTHYREAIEAYFRKLATDGAG
jgi:tetratricopeptide (TPR) repeat protein